MKRFLQITALAVLVTLVSSSRNEVAAQPGYGDDISYQDFYDDLSPYGNWVDYPEYGYVWTPSGIPGFRPYETGGHWVWTDEYEWMWASDYSWGWAPFHYGRWFYDPYYGWMWLPGYEWAPAWVAWRDGGDYYGWAPLRPGFSIGINISIGSYNPPVDYWCFAPRRYISSPHVYNYCVDRSRNITIINNTTIINNHDRRNNVFVTGPRRLDAERYAGRINPVRFRESSRPGRSGFRNNEISVYRPRVRQDNDRQFRPGNFARYDRNGNNGFARNRGSNRGNDNDRRNIFDRGNNTERPAAGTNTGRRPNVFDRGNNDQPGNGDRNGRRPGEQRDGRQPQPSTGNGNRTQRGNVFDRGNASQPQNGNSNGYRHPSEQRTRETRPQPSNDNGQPGRRNVFDRGQNRQAGNENNRAVRQPSPQPDRQQQQPRQFGNRGNGGGNSQGSNNQRGNDGGGRRAFARRG